MRKTTVLTVCALALAAGSAYGSVVVDLTTANQSGTINSGIYTNSNVHASGSGVIHSFVRVQGNTDTIQGYNTSGRPLQFDENNSPTFTRDLTYGEVPTVTIGGVDYKEFFLDINQQASNPLESLNQVAIFKSSTGGQTASNIFSLGTSVYQMNMGYGPGGTAITGGSSENRVELNYNVSGSGSGTADMYLYVPVGNFGSISSSTFLYLYSFFGIPNPNNAGYEEWAVNTPGPTVPLPPAVWAGLSGLGAVGGISYLRRRRMV